MKLATILWNGFLVMLTVYFLFVRWYPIVYEQARFQFQDPRGGNSMWPATLEMLLFVASFLACAAAASYLFNRKLGLFARSSAAVVSALLVAAWIACGMLSKHYTFPGEFDPSAFSLMFHIDGLGLLLIAVVCQFVTAVVGRGPVTLMLELFRRLFKRGDTMRPNSPR